MTDPLLEKAAHETEFYKLRGLPEPTRKDDTGVCQSDSDCKELQQFHTCCACRRRRCCAKHTYFCDYCGDHICDYCVPFTTPPDTEGAYRQRTLCAKCIRKVFSSGKDCLSYAFLMKFADSPLISATAPVPSRPVKTLPQRRLTVVYDLDEVLVHSETVAAANQFTVSQLQHFTQYKMIRCDSHVAAIRPGVFEQLETLFESGVRFGVFTAASSDYAGWVAQEVFAPLNAKYRDWEGFQSQPEFIRDRSHCLIQIDPAYATAQDAKTVASLQARLDRINDPQLSESDRLIKSVCNLSHHEQENAVFWTKPLAQFTAHSDPTRTVIVEDFPPGIPDCWKTHGVVVPHFNTTTLTDKVMPTLTTHLLSLAETEGSIEALDKDYWRCGALFMGTSKKRKTC